MTKKWNLVSFAHSTYKNLLTQNLKKFQSLLLAGIQCVVIIPVTDKKGLGQAACPKEWKKYEEGNE